MHRDKNKHFKNITRHIQAANRLSNQSLSNTENQQTSNNNTAQATPPLQRVTSRKWNPLITTKTTDDGEFPTLPATNPKDNAIAQPRLTRQNSSATKKPFSIERSEVISIEQRPQAGPNKNSPEKENLEEDEENNEWPTWSIPLVSRRKAVHQAPSSIASEILPQSPRSDKTEAEDKEQKQEVQNKDKPTTGKKTQQSALSQAKTFFKNKNGKPVAAAEIIAQKAYLTLNADGRRLFDRKLKQYNNISYETIIQKAITDIQEMGEQYKRKNKSAVRILAHDPFKEYHINQPHTSLQTSMYQLDAVTRMLTAERQKSPVAQGSPNFTPTPQQDQAQNTPISPKTPLIRNTDASKQVIKSESVGHQVRDKLFTLSALTSIQNSEQTDEQDQKAQEDKAREYDDKLALKTVAQQPGSLDPLNKNRPLTSAGNQKDQQKNGDRQSPEILRPGAPANSGNRNGILAPPTPSENKNKSEKSQKHLEHKPFSINSPTTRLLTKILGPSAFLCALFKYRNDLYNRITKYVKAFSTVLRKSRIRNAKAVRKSKVPCDLTLPALTSTSAANRPSTLN